MDFTRTLDSYTMDVTWFLIIDSDWWARVSDKRRLQYSDRQLRRRGFLDEGAFFESVYNFFHR